ncbi:MAG: hypothetical protein RLZZ390_361 [Bacteroidota bacterium]
MGFENREDAGQQLSTLLIEKNISADCVITIPRGGIPVALVVAKSLHLPLKLILVRKLGHPINSEFAIGAITEKNILVHNDSFIKEGHPEIAAPTTKYKNVILVDDGIATGTCIELAIEELRKNGAKTITVATPVCPFNTYQHIKKIADETICCIVAQQFTGISAFYHNFEQLSDDQVKNLLEHVQN